MTGAMLLRRARKALNETVAVSRAMRFIFDDLPLAGLMACDTEVLQAIEALNIAADAIRLAAFVISDEGAKQREENNNDVQ